LLTKELWSCLWKQVLVTMVYILLQKSCLRNLRTVKIGNVYVFLITTKVSLLAQSFVTYKITFSSINKNTLK
jgi:hypothetical protein